MSNFDPFWHQTVHETIYFTYYNVTICSHELLIVFYMLTIIFKEFHSEKLWDSDFELVKTRNSLNFHQYVKAPIQVLSKENETSIQTNHKMPELIKAQSAKCLP